MTKTKVVEMIKGDKVVRLVGCCHIGMGKYYKELEKELVGFTLYEGVDGMEHIDLGCMYTIFAQTFGLEYQGDYIKAKEKEDWIRSDLHADILINADSDLEKELIGICDVTKFAPLQIVMEKYSDRKKRFIFKCIMKFANVFKIFQDSNKDKAKINLRNDRVIHDILKYSIEKNHINVFYGQGHMKDIIKRLKWYGFKVDTTRKYKVL